MQALSLNKPKAALLMSATILCLGFVQASASAPANSSAGQLKLNATKGDSNWKIYQKNESECVFTAKSSIAKNKATELTVNFFDCDAVVQINYSNPGKNIVIVDAPSERGGQAYVLYATPKKIYSRLVSYQSTEEETLAIKLVKNKIYLQTSNDKKVVLITATGELAVVEAP
jgi:hypothetical protein